MFGGIILYIFLLFRQGLFLLFFYSFSYLFLESLFLFSPLSLLVTQETGMVEQHRHTARKQNQGGIDLNSSRPDMVLVWGGGRGPSPFAVTHCSPCSSPLPGHSGHYHVRKKKNKEAPQRKSPAPRRPRTGGTTTRDLAPDP